MAERVKVKEPLTPQVLEELGVLQNLPENANFSPLENWKQTYLIWVQHGYIHDDRTNGLLTIERLNHGSNDNFTLKVDQQVLARGGVINHIKAEVICKPNRLSTPLSWTLKSTITNKGIENPGLNYHETANVEGQIVWLNINGEKSKRAIAQNYTADWCLFDAVQRMPFERSAPLDFDVLQGLLISKESQSLAYRPDFETHLVNQNFTLKAFDQVGFGNLPYVYWLDNNHRLRLVISSFITYLQIPEAEQKFQERLELFKYKEK